MNMTEKEYATPCGTIHYWVSGADLSGPPVVFLPGLTADHRLFEKQIEYFEESTRFSSGTRRGTPRPGPLR